MCVLDIADICVQTACILAGQHHNDDCSRSMYVAQMAHQETPVLASPTKTCVHARHKQLSVRPAKDSVVPGCGILFYHAAWHWTALELCAT